MNRRAAVVGMLATMADPALAQNKFPIFTVNSPLTWLPLIGTTQPTFYADFTTEGTTNHYWANAAQYGGFTSWLAGVGGAFARAGTAYYTNSSGLLASAANDVLRFDYNPSTLTLTGILLEGASTNLALWSRDLTNVAWVKSNATALLDQTGADGTANSASSVLATAGNATVLQTITQSSTSDTYSVYIKRITGTGEIDITLDGGATWTNITSQINSSTYTRVNHNQTVTNSSFGVRIVTNTDKIAVDFNQIEAVSFTTSPILTTTGTVARVADNLNAPWTSTTSTFILNSINQANNSGDSARFIGSNTGGGGVDTPLFQNTITTLATFSGALLTKPGAVVSWSSANKLGVAGSNTSRILTANGLVAVSDANALFSATPATIYIGANGIGAEQTYGDIQQLGAWTVAATAAQLQVLTG